jgi:tetratricopeptide (TPR) repeat protein
MVILRPGAVKQRFSGPTGGCDIIARMSTLEPTPVAEPKTAPKRRFPVFWVVIGALLLSILAGSVAGYFVGKDRFARNHEASVFAFDLEQFQLAGSDIAAGNYSVALQRLDAILKNEPDFPGAADLREKALVGMDATPTPLPTETPVPSPTLDAPRAEQLLAQAKQQFVDKLYPEMIKTLLTMKVEIPDYQPERIDGLIWVALRFNGVHLIKETNRLTEGMYYLDLASNYAPLDKEAANLMSFAQNFLATYQAAYYFKTKDIEKSLTYFEAAIALLPYYSDRLIPDYVDVLVQNGDSLVNQNACVAWWFYERALARLPDNEAALKGRDYAQSNCGEPQPVPPSWAEGEATPAP